MQGQRNDLDAVIGRLGRVVAKSAEQVEEQVEKRGSQLERTSGRLAMRVQ